jgi:Uma2 family endonuclease
MATRAPTALVEDRDWYPIHEEDDVAEIPFHKEQTTDLYDALRVRFPQYFVTGNVCIYWERGNRSLYRAPDLFVAAGKPADPEPRVYLTWSDPPILFVAEIGSRSTLREDEGPKVEIYQDHIRAAEYLYSNPPKGDLRMWRMGDAGYEEVTPEPNGRLRSAELDLEFGIEGGFLRIYTPDGERLRTHEEAEQLLAEQAQLRQEAEARAAAERARREELERRLAEMEAQLQRQGPDRQQD